MMIGRLVRQIPVRLVNLSLSGCLIQTTHQIDAGTTGELRITLRSTQQYPATTCLRESSTPLDLARRRTAASEQPGMVETREPEMSDD